MVATATDTIFQALSLDTCVLEALLRRNRNNHGRTLYYRRMSMVLRAVQRSGVVDFGDRLQSLQSDTLSWSQTRRRRRETEEQWDLKGKGEDKEQLLLQQEFRALFDATTKTLPELLSRIQHASSPLFLEVSRGFFLPFCTVALGSLARLRTLIVQIGRNALMGLNEVQATPGMQIDTFSSRFQSAMNLLVDPEPTGNEDANKGRELLLESLGFGVVRKTPTLQNENVTKETHLVEESTSSWQKEIEPKTEGYENEDGLRVREGNRKRKAEDDLGEILDFVGTGEGPTSDPQGAPTTQKPVALLDSNMDLVANFKEKKRGSKEKTKSSTKKKESTKAKKKKKKAKGDFFDGLFG